MDRFKLSPASYESGDHLQVALDDPEIDQGMRQLAELAETHGLDSMWISEYHFTDDEYAP